MSLRFRIVLSLAFAMLGVVSCLAYASSVRTEAEKVRSDAIERFGGEVAQLVVADQALEVGDVITERNVRKRDWVADLAPEGAIVSLQDVVGKEVRVPVSKGAPLTDLNFRDESTLAKVPSGHVAVSVPVTDKLGISRGVLRGARISAYTVSEDGPHLIASDIEVLSELSAGGSLSAQQITIAMLPEDVATVLGASATGDLRLVIPADDVDMPSEQDEEKAEPPVEMVPEEGVEA